MQERIKYLFRKYLNNTATPEELDEIFAALDDRENDIYLEECMDEQLPVHSPAYPHRKRNFRTVLAIAATLLIPALAGIGWFMISSRKEAVLAGVPQPVKTTLTSATQRSEYKYLLLPDSTQVWLNAASTLEFPRVFGGGARVVYLKGEAYFDVRHADRTPFIIHTGQVSTVVLGTAFNIKAYPDLEKITVSVKRGKVKVKYQDREVAVLTRGQEVVIGNMDQKIKERQIKTQDAMTWHEGNLVYDDYLIGDIISDIERIYDVKIAVPSADLRQLRVSTAFKRAQGAETALDILCRLTDSHLTLDNGTYTIMTTNKTKI